MQRFNVRVLAEWTNETILEKYMNPDRIWTVRLLHGNRKRTFHMHAHRGIHDMSYPGFTAGPAG